MPIQRAYTVCSLMFFSDIKSGTEHQRGTLEALRPEGKGISMAENYREIISLEQIWRPKRHIRSTQLPYTTGQIVPRHNLQER